MGAPGAPQAPQRYGPGVNPGPPRVSALGGCIEWDHRSMKSKDARDSAELVYQFRDPVRASDGTTYVAQAWGQRNDGWHSWLVFIAADGGILRTEREKAYASRDAVLVWAVGLRPTDLARALARAVPPSAQLPAA